MNKGQLIFMWVGIAVLVGFCFVVIDDRGLDTVRCLIWFLSVVFIIVSITAGLVASARMKPTETKA